MTKAAILIILTYQCPPELNRIYFSGDMDTMMT